MRTKLRGKVTLLFMMLGLVLAIAGVAIADTLNVNDLVTGGDVSVTKPSTQATQGQAQIYLVATNSSNSTDPLNGCNANPTNPVTVTFTNTAVDANNNSIASPVTLGANSVQLTGCDDTAQAGIQNAATLNYTVATTANVGDKITIKGTASGGRTNPTSGTFTTDQFVITIVAPPEKGTTLTVDPASGTYGGSADLKATLACPTCAAGTDLSGKIIDFTLNGNSVGSATTNSSGVAIKSGVSLSGIDAGTYADAVSASYAGTGSGCTTNCYGPSNGSATLTVNKAAGSVSINNIPSNAVFGGSFTPTYTKAGDGTASTTSNTPSVCSVDNSGVVSFDAAGTCKLQASVAEGTNHLQATGAEQTFEIAKAPTTTTVTCTGGPFTYTGNPITPCSVSVTGAGGLNLSPTPDYSNNVNAGTATASYTYAESANHLSSTDSENFTIDKATAQVTLGNLGPHVWDGNAKVASVATTPAGLNVTVTYNGNSQAPSAVGSYNVVATVNEQNYEGQATGTLVISAWTLKGFYAPVDYDTATTKIWNTVKGGATVPLKFEIFKGTTESSNTADVDKFIATGVVCPGASAATDDIEITTTGGTQLRYDTTAGQFIQNWQTPKKPGACYDVTMQTDDGTKLPVAHFMLK